ncbi:CHAP domain-containing protein [Azospirillum brasilense]|nr:CHAP domain-containing protein [Azospirillum brasilense]
MISRRSILREAALLGATGASGVTLSVNAARAQGTVEDADRQNASMLDKFGFIGPEDDPIFGPLITGMTTTAQVGTMPSRHEEVWKAFQLLLGMKGASSHVAAAQYFMDIKDKNKDGELYSEEWKTRANPLIVGFFSLTNTKPSEGDQTHWCAAFVNTCLYAAGLKGTYSALSGSFRHYGEATDSPEMGDIAVFAATGDRGKQGFGHVGIFLKRTKDSVILLGGNQRGGTGSTGAVTEATYNIKGSDLVLHSYRKITKA